MATTLQRGDSSTTPREVPSNDEVCRAYLDWQQFQRRRKRITVYQYASKLENLLEHLESTHLSVVRQAQLDEWLGRQREGRGHGEGSPATLQKEASILRGLYRFACTRWPDVFVVDPTALISTPTVKNRNPKPVPDETWVHLWGCERLPDEARVVLGLGFFGGLRRKEFALLRRGQVHLPSQRLVHFERKGGGDDVLHYGELLGLFGDELPELLVGGAASLLEPLARLCGRRARVEPLLEWAGAYGARIHETGGNDPHLIYNRLTRWLTTADLPPTAFTPHQLRHSFVTNLLRAGVPLHLTSVLANHADVSITMRYAKLGGADLRAFRARAPLRSRDYTDPD